MTNSTVHIPVLPGPVIELGNPKAGEFWVDGTAGGGGHCQLLLERIGAGGKLLAIDRDPLAVERLSHFKDAPNVAVRQSSYDQLPELLDEMSLPAPDGILLDLGLSSDQLADRSRGFSFQGDGELDMRFDPTSGEPAWEWLARVDEKTLADTIYRYGEERFSRRIARNVVETRKQVPIRTASELRDLILRSVPTARRTKHGPRHGKVDPATRTFQALRIAVNEELSILENALQQLPNCLANGGRLMIISFHSLEDRLVKYAYRGDERLRIVTRRPVQADESEIEQNPRSRSAKLRVAVREVVAPS